MKIRELKMKEEPFRALNGQAAFHADDNDPTWYAPSTNPFWQGCCYCGLMHRVEYRVVKGALELRFTVDEKETERLRHYLASRPEKGRR